MRQESLSPLLLIVDGNNALLRAHFAMQKAGLSTADGRPTGGLFGTIRIHLSYIQKLKPSHVIWFFDSKSRYRLSLDSEYKANRSSDNKTEMSFQFDEFQRFLSLTDTAYYTEQGMEADDLIAQTVKQYRHELPISILSADHDLLQLVRKDPHPVSIIKPREGNAARLAEKTHTYQSVKEAWQMEPYRLPEVWALSGDSGDNIPGVPRFGEKTAWKTILEYGDLAEVIAKCPKIDGYQDRVWKNYQMITLPYENQHDVPISLQDMEFDGAIHTDALREFFELYEMKSFLEKMENGSLWL